MGPPARLSSGSAGWARRWRAPEWMANFLCVAAGGVFMVWPALVNGYPIVFSDTGGFLEQALMPDMGWDKPWTYGPFLTPFHWQVSLWPAVFVQALILSASLWIVQAVLRRPSRLLHLLLCAVLAVGTAAPWFASLLMPDIFAPVCVLTLFALGAGTGAGRGPAQERFRDCPAAVAAGGDAVVADAALSRPAQAWVCVVATIAIAVHLAHLILAAACIGALGLLHRRIPWRPAVPLAAALGLILLTNLVGHGVLAISPYGADFALARLVADGPARDLVQRRCPQAGWRLCAWKDRLPTDSDDFLWDPNGPVWADGYGPVRIAPEAARIVAATVAAEPVAVLRAALGNTGRQLLMTKVGDALTPDYLDVAVLARLRTYFPEAEARRFMASLQYKGSLPGVAAHLALLRAWLLVLGAGGTVGTAVLCWRRRPPVACLAVLTLVALLANAFSTGALSRPHDRYQARIAWLVVVPPVFALAGQRRWAGPSGRLPERSAGRVGALRG